MYPESAKPNLKREDVPGPKATWGEIAEFALTHDGYRRGFDSAAALGNGWARRYTESGELPASMDELRDCLLFEQRRYHHFGTAPDGAPLEYIRSLVAAIRELAGDSSHE